MKQNKLLSTIISLALAGTLALGTATIQGAAEETTPFSIRTPGNGIPRETWPDSLTTDTPSEQTPETKATETPAVQTPETKATETPETKATETPETKTTETPETKATEENVSIKATVPVESVSTKTNQDGKVIVSWKKSSKKKTKKQKKALKKAKKIEVQYSTDKDFNKKVKTETIKKNATEVVLKKAKKNKTYYVRMRYIDEEGNVSEWSEVSKIKTGK